MVDLDCIDPGVVNASMIHRNVTQNPRETRQDDRSRRVRAAIRRADQEAVLEVEVIPHPISATDLATVARLFHSSIYDSPTQA